MIGEGNQTSQKGKKGLMYTTMMVLMIGALIIGCMIQIETSINNNVTPVTIHRPAKEINGEDINHHACLNARRATRLTTEDHWDLRANHKTESVRILQSCKRAERNAWKTNGVTTDKVTRRNAVSTGSSPHKIDNDKLVNQFSKYHHHQTNYCSTLLVCHPTLLINMNRTHVYDANGVPLVAPNAAPLFLASNGDIVDHDGNVYTYVPATNVLSNAGGDVVAQPNAPTRIQTLVAIIQRTAPRPPIAAAATFALAPGTVSRNVIDYSTKEGISIHKEATKSLYRDDAGLFPLSGLKLFDFLGKLEQRARSPGWEDPLLMVSTAIPYNHGNSNKNLLTNYGEITETMVRSEADHIASVDNREKQEDSQLYACVINSLSPNAQQRVNLQTLRTKDSNGNASGLLLVLAVIQLSSVDTKATVNNLRNKLNAGLSDIMANHGNNVTAFNDEVRLIQADLSARGEDPSKIVPQLFKVYSEMGNGEGKLGRYIEMLENNYSDGTDYTDVSLMEKVESKYKEVTDPDATKSEGVKGAKPDEKYVALQSQIKDLATLLAKSTTTTPGNRKENGGQDGKNRSSERGKTRKILDELPAPKEGEPRTYKIGEKVYHYCDGGPAGHKPKWVAHDPANCDAKKAGNQQSDGGNSTPPAYAATAQVPGYESD